MSFSPKSRQGARFFSCAPFVIVCAFLFFPLSHAALFLGLPAAALAASAPADDSLFEADAPVSGSSGKHPKFTLLYNAMTMGEVHPCPT